MCSSSDVHLNKHHQQDHVEAGAHERVHARIEGCRCRRLVRRAVVPHIYIYRIDALYNKVRFASPSKKADQLVQLSGICVFPP